MSARVFLDETFLGQLTPNVTTQTTGFEFDAGYAVQGARPVLGRCFEDHDISPPRRFDGSPLPNDFRNLLPEGALRKVSHEAALTRRRPRDACSRRCENTFVYRSASWIDLLVAR